MARLGRGRPFRPLIRPVVIAAAGGGRTTPSVRDKTSYASAVTAETSAAVPIPSGAVAGDVHYIFCQLTASAGAITTPTGYTAVVPQFDSENSTSAESACFRKDTTLSGGGGTVTISFSSGRFAAASLAVRDVDTSVFEDVAGASDNGPAGTATAIDAPTLTPANANSLLLTGHTGRRATVGEAVTYLPPSGMAEEVDVSSAVAAVSNASVEVASLAVLDTNPTGVKTATADLAVSASGMSVLVRGAQAGGVSASAEAATGTGTANDASVDLTATGDQATGVGAATDAQGGIGAQAEAATGTGAAQGATVDLAAQPPAATGTGAATDPQAALTVNAEAATGTGAAFDATVSTETATQAPAGVAEGTGSALDASVAITVDAGAASGTGTAPDAQGGIGAQPGAGSGTGAATDPQAALTVNAEAATGTGAAFDATVSTETATQAPADVATGVGAALDPSTAFTVTAGVATGAGAANNAVAQIGIEAPAGVATGTGAALDAAVAIGAQAEAATGTGLAPDAEGFIPPPQPPPRWAEGAAALAGLIEGTALVIGSGDAYGDVYGDTYGGQGGGLVEGTLVGAGIIEGGAGV